MYCWAFRSPSPLRSILWSKLGSTLVAFSQISSCNFSSKRRDKFIWLASVDVRFSQSICFGQSQQSEVIHSANHDAKLIRAAGTAREKSREQITNDHALASDWLRMWREVFEPITKRRTTKQWVKIISDTQLKIALIVLFYLSFARWKSKNLSRTGVWEDVNYITFFRSECITYHFF